MKVIKVETADEAINIDSISHIRLIQNRKTNKYALLFFQNGNRKKLLGEQDFAIRFDSYEDAYKVLLQIMKNSENISMV